MVHRCASQLKLLELPPLSGAVLLLQPREGHVGVRRDLRGLRAAVGPEGTGEHTLPPDDRAGGVDLPAAHLLHWCVTVYLKSHFGGYLGTFLHSISWRCVNVRRTETYSYSRVAFQYLSNFTNLNPKPDFMKSAGC